MKSKTDLFIELWNESRSRLTNQLVNLKPEDLSKKLPPSQNSVGFIIRHVADVELLFAKNVYGNTSVSVVAKTVIDKRDTGEWTDLEALKAYVAHSYDKLSAIIKQQSDLDWETQIKTKEFGILTKAEAFGRIVSHTAYHAGQMALFLKYGLHMPNNSLANL